VPGDSTTSQHGYLYNTNTGSYKFLDDPAAAFHNGVEITQITGISNSGEIAGFYTDANGTFHSFTANPTPEPGSLFLVGFNLVVVGLGYFRRRRKAHAAAPRSRERSSLGSSGISPATRGIRSAHFLLKPTWRRNAKPWKRSPNQPDQGTLTKPITRTHQVF
jgi:hypothetical protein